MGFSPVHLPCKLPHGRFPWTLSRCRLQCSLSKVDFWFNFFRVYLRAIFSTGDFNGSICEGFFVRSFARVSSLRFSAGTFYLHCLVGSFFVLFFVCAFPMDFFAQLLPCSLSWGCFPWHSFAVEISIGSYPGAFTVRSSQWLFRHALSQKFLQRALLQGFFSRPLSESFFRTLPRRVLPVGFSQGHLLCSPSHGRFPISFQRVVFSALCHRKIFSATFSGAFSVRFFAGKISMGSIAGAFSAHSLMWSFYPALFCKGDIHKLLRGG